MTDPVPRFAEAPPVGTCPHTGLPVLSPPEWTDVDFSRHLAATVSRLGESILVLDLRGFLTFEDSIKVSDFVKQHVLPTMAGDRHLALVQDLSRFQGASRRVRNSFFQQIDALPFTTFLGFGASPIQSFAIRLAMRLHRFDASVRIVRDYPEAVRQAALLTSASHRETRPLAGRPSLHPDMGLDPGSAEAGPRTAVATSAEVRTQPDWSAEVDGASVSFQLMSGQVLHATYSGLAAESLIETTANLREKVRRGAGAAFGLGYLVTDQTQLKGLNRQLQRTYLQALRQWHGKYPFRAYIVYGVSRRTRALLLLYRPFLPFPVRVAQDLADAFEILKEYRRPRRHAPTDSGRTTTESEVQRYAAELIQFIGSIDWDQPGVDLSHVGESHPFKHVYQGIAIVKAEIEQLLEGRQRMIKALVASEEKYRTIIENIEEGYFETDIEGNFTFFNDSFAASLGTTREEAARLNCHDILGSEDLAKTFRVLGKAHSDHRPKTVVSWQAMRADGTTIFIEAVLTPYRDTDGRIIGLRGVARDTTERRKIEEEKRRLEKQLEHARKMEAIGTLAGGVAHDLNNILSGMVSYPDLLLMDLAEDSVLRGPLLTIRQSGEKAATIVNDLLSLARIGLTTQEVSNLNNAIREYLKSPEFHALEAERRDIEVVTDLDPSLLNVMGSQVHLSKTLMNLVSNAIEAIPKGGKISLSTENRYLDLPVSGYEGVEAGDYVVVCVADSGVGIAEEDLKRIFEPFYTKKIMGRSGTGLGMAVVWATVKDHGGYIDVESREGKGTTFTLFFPATREETTESARISTEDCMGDGESILIVDDVEEQRAIVSEMLEKLGYSVTTVASGEEGVEYLKNATVDLVVLDMIMDPGMDGLETYRRIVELHPGQKAIITSGFSESERVKETQRLGAGSYLKKPYLIDGIGMAVKKALLEKDKTPPRSGF